MCSQGWGNLVAIDWNDLPVDREFDDKFLKNVKSPPHALHGPNSSFLVFLVDNNYSRLSLDGHLYKTDTSVKRTPRVGPCLSLLLLFDSLKDGHLSKMDT